MLLMVGCPFVQVVSLGPMVSTIPNLHLASIFTVAPLKRPTSTFSVSKFLSWYHRPIKSAPVAASAGLKARLLVTPFGFADFLF